MEKESHSAANRRIAKNTLILYIRMFLTMFVGLYTNRVVLATLGVEDYGIYGVVGGVVAIMGILNASMSGATSRFLTFELGHGDKNRLVRTFSNAMIAHIGIAIVVFILAETIGLWFLCNKLNIPEGRMSAAHWVYQCSIFSAMLGITQVPYNASIIAHEKMDVYAYVEILNVTLKLLIVYLLVIGDFDKLKLYAILVLAVSIVIRMTYRIYCKHHFQETHIQWSIDKAILKPLLTFSGWDLYGNGCVTIKQQGTNFLINIFFGVAFNAASAIATTVNGIILSLSGNVTQAFRPVIIKDYAKKDIAEMQNHINNALKYMILMFGCLFIPVYLETNYLFELWLVNVPDCAVIFCRLILIAAVFRLLNHIINIPIHATGRIRGLSFISGSLILISVPITYVLFRYGFNAESAYVVEIVINSLTVISGVSIMKILIPELKVTQMLSAILKSTTVLVIVGMACLFIHVSSNKGFLRLFCVVLFDIITISSLTYCFVIDKSTREQIKSKLHFSNH